MDPRTAEGFLPPFEPRGWDDEGVAFAEVYADPEFRRELEASRPPGAVVRKVVALPGHQTLFDSLRDDVPAGEFTLVAVYDIEVRFGWRVVWMLSLWDGPSSGRCQAVWLSATDEQLVACALGALPGRDWCGHHLDRSNGPVLVFKDRSWAVRVEDPTGGGR